MKTFTKMTQIGMSGLGNILLATTAIGVAATGILLTGLYIIEHAKETPALVRLQCVAGFKRSDCPGVQDELASLKNGLEILQSKTAAAQTKLDNLRAVETSVDSVTIFETTDIPETELEVTVGTVYSRIVEPEQSPDYFCYIQLPSAERVNRNLYIRNSSGAMVDIDRGTLKRAGVSEKAYRFALSRCQPTLIEGPS